MQLLSVAAVGIRVEEFTLLFKTALRDSEGLFSLTEPLKLMVNAFTLIAH